MPALMTKGMSTGVKINTVGVKSSAVPTTTTKIMRTTISNVLLPMSGSIMRATSAGMLATVINHALTMAAATKNMMTEVVLPAAKVRLYNLDHCSSR